MRSRIAATAAVLVLGALAAAGLIVYLIESQRVEAATSAQVEQELDEFVRLEREGIDPRTGRDFASIEDLVELFLERNVPDDDELLVGWVEGRPVARFPDDELVLDPEFQRVADRLARTGGSTELVTDEGPVLVAAQPVRQGRERGALVVAVYLEEDREELLDTMRTYAVVAALLTVLVVAAAAWQSGRLLAPLRLLRATADELRETDLSRRIPESGNDDITALTRTVNAMLDRLETAFGDQRKFLDDAGHELRTPLTVLRGHLELLDVDNPAEVAETRALLLDEVDRMARLVGDLILLAKSDRPDFVTPAPVDVAALTEDVLAKVRALADREWVLDGVADVTVRVDRQRITQALLQLADNAVKHTGPDDTVAVGSSYDGRRVLLWVRDSGPGVPVADRQRIFERFGRGSAPEGDEGFGLGLSIVRAIVVAHGGTVHVEDGCDTVGDGAGRGARFVLALPAGVVAEEDTWLGS